LLSFFANTERIKQTSRAQNAPKAREKIFDPIDFDDAESLFVTVGCMF